MKIITIIVKGIEFMNSLKEVPQNDPLKSAEQKAMIDQAIAENRTRPGAVMLVLNEVQGKIGHVPPSCKPILQEV